MDNSFWSSGKDDCCMTATKKNMVYIMEKPKPRSEQQVKADAKRVADAVSRAAKFLKK